MACELVAIGCLVAHGDIDETRPLVDEWSAGIIMKGLERLHPKFYPLPSIQTRGSDGIIRMTDDNEVDYIKKEELLALNGRCGNFVHRGTSAKLFSEGPDVGPEDFDKIAKYARRIYGLIGLHAMLLFDGSLFGCGLNTGPEGKISAWIAKER